MQITIFAEFFWLNIHFYKKKYLSTPIYSTLFQIPMSEKNLELSSAIRGKGRDKNGQANWRIDT